MPPIDLLFFNYSENEMKYDMTCKLPVKQSSFPFPFKVVHTLNLHLPVVDCRTQDSLIYYWFWGRWERGKYLHLHTFLTPRRRCECIINIFHACNKPSELPSSAVPSWSFTGTASWRDNSLGARAETRTAGLNTDLGTNK